MATMGFIYKSCKVSYNLNSDNLLIFIAIFVFDAFY